MGDVLFLALLKNLRPSQWLKNIFVLAPLFFAQRITESAALLQAAKAFAIFCMLAGGVYLWNDLSDLEEDRKHPKKRMRPLASGELPVTFARFALFFLWSSALLFSQAISLGFLLCGATYILINVLYSRWLRTIAFVDVTCIALGFLLRVLAGGEAVHVVVSSWMLLTTFMLAFFMGLGKRYQELHSNTSARTTLSQYKPNTLRLLLYLTGAVTCLLYLLYASLPSTRAYFQSNLILATIPFPFLGIGRFLYLTHTTQESPTDAILRDVVFLVIVFLWSLLIFWIVL